MDFRAAPSSRPDAAGLTPLGRRHHYRHQIQSLAYVNLDQANGGIIRNLGDAGIAIQAVAPLYKNQQILLRFDLANPRVRLEATGRVAWADPIGQAGVEFLLLSPRSRRLLKEWLFVQLMASAERSSGECALSYGQSGQQSGQEADQLLFSTGARPAIRLEPAATATPPARELDQQTPVKLPWLPFAISAPALSWTVDGLVLLASVLLFAVICMVMVGVIPAWPVALVVGIGVAAIFALLYRFLFLFWIGGTPGDWLAGITRRAFTGNEIRAEDRPRFR